MNTSADILKSPSEGEGLMNLLEWTQQKIGSGIQIVKEMGNMLDLKFLQEENKLDKQVITFSLWVCFLSLLG